MNGPVRTAIFPVAGRGSRLLPATRAVPKELLPVLDKPLIDFAIEEAVAAGIQRLVFVTSPEKDAIRRHVMAGHAANADPVSSPEIIFVQQSTTDGLGHAVLCARQVVLPGPVAVVLPDDLILGPVGCLSELVAACAGLAAGHLVATMRVPESAVSRYGILSVTEDRAPLLLADTMVEKPEPCRAPSRDAVVGRYVLDPCIFDAIAALEPGAGGEIQLTDAIAETAPQVGLAGLRFTGRRFDCGSKLGLFQAALFRAQLDPAYRTLLSPALDDTAIASAA
jgi:UTP--glucose-1-phosphate uridylyltransferase